MLGSPVSVHMHTCIYTLTNKGFYCGDAVGVWSTGNNAAHELVKNEC